ncbi:MAG: serine protease [Oligoflexia bacterium]|nr:MAG: serine protease [Oligoflexia bacterium]
MKNVRGILEIGILAISTASSLIACGPKYDSSMPDSPLEIVESSEGIIGGSVVDSTDPLSQSTVALMDISSGSLCTGTIVASNLVLTAAHCTSSDPTSTVVIFSTTLPDSIYDIMGKTIRHVVGGKASPLWAKLQNNQEKNWGDIALLKFSGKLPEGFKPARLLNSKKSLKDGMLAVLAGFGLMDGVKKTESSEMRKTTVSIQSVHFSETEVMFDQSKGKGACHGDSGGPAYVTIGGKSALMGVTSRGINDPRDTCGVSSIYTSVSAHMSWLKSTAAELMSPKYKPEPIAQPANFFSL